MPVHRGRDTQGAGLSDRPAQLAPYIGIDLSPARTVAARATPTAAVLPRQEWTPSGPEVTNQQENVAVAPIQAAQVH